jgi:Lon protease-like protein
MGDDELEARCSELPIFPLPRVVLMRGDSLPLHVFEPRYRALLAHCLAADGLMGIATLRPARPDVGGQPAISPEVGVGRIVRHEPYPDGRANIVLEHVAHARVVRELPSKQPFRVVEAQMCVDIPASDDLTPLRALLLQLAATTPSNAADAQRIARLENGLLVDELARRLLDETDERLQFVALDAVDAKARVIARHLAALFQASHPRSIDA